MRNIMLSMFFRSTKQHLIGHCRLQNKKHSLSVEKEISTGVHCASGTIGSGCSPTKFNLPTSYKVSRESSTDLDYNILANKLTLVESLATYSLRPFKKAQI